jgi:hypothetical protein
MQCQRWGVLPEAGGLFQQPLGLFTRMEAALTAYNCVRSEMSVEPKKKAEWARRNPQIAEYCQWLDKIREELED